MNVETARGTWSVTWHGLRTVALLELRQRLRSTRWKVALTVWFVAVGGITALTSGALPLYGGGDDAGGMIYTIVVFFVLFLGLLVAPALTAASINGDRNAGTLATLQVTLLTPAEIVFGKLLAAWAAALAFLVVSVPFIVWALLEGGVEPFSIVTTMLMLALVLGVVCAIGLGFSALVSKSSASAVLTYLTIGTLTAVLPVVFGLLVPLTTTQDEVRVWAVPHGFDWAVDERPPECEWRTETEHVWHSERTWWLLAPNPFVVVADAQPLGDPDDQGSPPSGLKDLQYGVRYARTGPSLEMDYCGGLDRAPSPVEEVEPTDAMVWPWGLGLQLLLAGGGVVVAVNRLRIPQRVLPQGTRVA
ncbi:ABC transporter permease [Antribacter gilvus]|uniref:ABC transporter permease n=1 Tax=Antribacter gilvus TaxID=2304675 RepID=UPI000F77ED1B|nr:ABC transporter permease [Antribacter gilvus]